jgi:hypothetical protein
VLFDLAGGFQMANENRPGLFYKPQPGIGPIGALARFVVGAVLIGLALFWREPNWRDPVFGLVVMPAIAVGLIALRARHSPAPLRATGPVGHALNAAVFIPLFALPATAGPAFFFYGASMLIAGTRRSGGCEVTAIPNMVLNRHDAVGCMLFVPVDFAEAKLGRHVSTSGASPQ